MFMHSNFNICWIFIIYFKQFHHFYSNEFNPLHYLVILYHYFINAAVNMNLKEYSYSKSNFINFGTNLKQTLLEILVSGIE